MSVDAVIEDLADLPTPCLDSIAAVETRVSTILRPGGALARLDELAVWVAGWQRTERPSVDRPLSLIFAGDHGVAVDGVSAYPPEVTGAMVEAVTRGKASVSAMAAVAGAAVRVIDVGVGKPTANIAHAPAMDATRFSDCFEAGREAVREAVKEADTDLLMIGELGIGNTTAAAAVNGALLKRPATDMVGGGTGVSGEALANKVAVVEGAIERARSLGAGPDEPLETLRQLGGTELVAMAGAIMQARRSSIPVLLDGYVTAASALALHRTDPTLTAHARAGHGSAEPGHRLVLEALGLQPLIELGLRLGEGSGAMAALPLVQMGCRLVTDVPTFEEWFGPAATDDEA